MKKLYWLLILVVISLQSLAYDFEVNGIYYNITNANTVAVTYNSYDDSGVTSLTYSGEVTIPSTVEHYGINYVVTSIGSKAFYCSRYLRKVNLPETISYIDAYAFYACSMLIEVNIPESLNGFGEFAFWGCSLLPRITLPNNVNKISKGLFQSCSNLVEITIPEGVIQIEDIAFQGCVKLVKVKLPSSLTKIGAAVFRDCQKLTDISIPDYVCEIGEMAFSNCMSLVRITIPEGVTCIGDQFFLYCLKLQDVVLPNSLVEIGSEAFSYCENLTNIIIPDNVKIMGHSVFSSCNSLKYVRLPKSLIFIDESTFSSCYQLMSIDIPEGVVAIGNGAFAFCYSLKDVTLPKGLMTIGNKAFVGCANLSSIVINEENVITIDERTFADAERSIPVYVPCESLEKYRFADYWSEFTNMIGYRYSLDIYSENGSVSYESSDMCSDEYTLELTAVAYPGFQFGRWSDGNTENPRLVSINKDTCFIAIFGESPVLDVVVKQPVCTSLNGEITLYVTKGASPYTFLWNDGSVEQNRVGLSAGIYDVTVTDSYGFYTTKTIVLSPDESNKPIIQAKTSNAICGQNVGEIELAISGGTEPYTYSWSDGSKDLYKKDLAPGTYNFSVTDYYGCKTDHSEMITAVSFRYQPELALVSVSQEVKDANLIIWQKEQTQMIDFYTIYRETSSMGEYAPIAIIPYSETSIYVDENTNNMKQAYKYKISATDFCHTESALSDYHKTVHLTKGTAIQGINLIWDGYVGFDYNSYSIYRVTTSGIEEIDQVPADSWTYTDLNPPVGTLSYYVAIRLPQKIDVNDPQMKAEGGPFVMTISNIAEAENRTDVSDLMEKDYKVYSNGMEIMVEGSDNQKVIVCEATGKKVFEGIANVGVPVKTAGVYIVIVGNKTFKVVVN